ncbi:MAG: lipid A deacylase LpxR family protein [Humidesulfovibrio sp.]|nr:lipid A deacylase LpxR family protein [Humidesulfovibrio sp.]
MFARFLPILSPRGLALACLSLACLALLTLAQTRPALAAQPEDTPGASAKAASTLILTEENDYFAGTDEQYTNGFKLIWISADLKKYAEDERLPSFAVAYLQRLPFVNEPGQQYNVAISAGQNMYVPHNTKIASAQPDDRPYAGWTYVSLALHAKTANQLDSFETSLGIVGPSALAGETQNTYHSMMGFKRVEGWRNQIHDEPGLMLSWQRTLRAMRVGLGRDVAWDLLPHARVTVGNVQTHAAAGFETRVGYRLPWDFGTSLIQPGGGVSAPANPDDTRLRQDDTFFGLHFFAGAEGRAVARNIFLDGNTWEKSGHVSKKPLVADLMAGVGLVLGKVKLTYTHVYRTEEFDGQDGPQKFGSVSLSVTF